MSERVIVGLTVVLAVLLLGVAGLIWLTQFQQPPSVSPVNDVNSTINTPTDKPFNNQCGGIAGILCPAGYTCVYLDEATYPDAAGLCVPNDL